MSHNSDNYKRNVHPWKFTRGEFSSQQPRAPKSARESGCTDLEIELRSLGAELKQRTMEDI